MNDRVGAYNVVWDSPSQDASGSMPLGNGDIALNVCVQESGDLLLLIAKTDAWDENSINLKLGRVRVTLTPKPVGKFRQTLDLRTATIEIEIGKARVRVWVDANQPVIHLEVTGAELEMGALEMWRTKPRVIKTQTGDLFRDLSGNDPHPTVVSPDQIRSDDERIVWCHHNEKREVDGYEINMKLQGLGQMLEKLPHPLAGRTFGAAIEQTRNRLAIYVLTMQPASVQQWESQLDATIASVKAVDPTEARRAHETWWEQFWARSWLFVSCEQVTRAYLLQRFMNACAGRAGPIKFNGSLFSVGRPDDPDFRRWGGPGFWFQNQRLIYWPMLAAGDFDLLRPWLRMYLNQLPLQRHRTRTYFGHDGAHYPETITFWGAEVSAHYGWTPFEKRERPEAECLYVRYYWTCGIELSLMLWENYFYQGDETFAREFLLPIADAVTEFFDLHYPRDAAGKIRFEPAQALETWHEAVNPLPEIAGLRYLLPKLLALPEKYTTQAQRARWRRMLGELPNIPIGEKDGKRVILPAERFEKKKNVENPELYCVFPFRLYGVGKSDLEVARDTFAARLHQSHECWSQDEIQMAYLGLAEQARDFLTRRASDASHSDSRFPAFWNAFHDWIPDMDHGGVLQLALQSMLMQCEGDRILLLPAWPSDWDVDFKLHAPKRTIVEGRVRGGKLIELRVTPEDRRADVIICDSIAGGGG